MTRFRSRPVLLFAVAVALAWAYFRFWHPHPIRDDRALVVLLVVGLGFAALSQLAGTERWGARELGVFAAVAGTALLYLNFLVGLWDLGETPAWYDALYRALLLVGSVVLCVVGPRYLRDRRRDRRGRDGGRDGGTVGARRGG